MLKIQSDTPSVYNTKIQNGDDLLTDARIQTIDIQQQQEGNRWNVYLKIDQVEIDVVAVINPGGIQYLNRKGRFIARPKGYTAPRRIRVVSKNGPRTTHITDQDTGDSLSLQTYSISLRANAIGPHSKWTADLVLVVP